MRRTRTQQINAVTDIIKKNPKITISDLINKTRVNITYVFGGIRNAYAAAEIPYYKKSRDVKLKDIINYIQKNNLATTYEINAALNCNFYKYFKSLNDAYLIANVQYISRNLKRAERKRYTIINYIKTHPDATQRDVNSACKTKVQEIFSNGICEAFKQADTQYDFSRRNLHGAALKSVRLSAKALEKNLADILQQRFEKLGKVFEQVKINAGIIDILLELRNKRIVIEVKDYKAKSVSLSDVQKVKNYVKDINANIGIIITKRKLNKHNDISGIKIFELTELDKMFSFLEEPNSIYYNNFITR